MFSRELKKGSTELLVLSLLEARPRHGYEIGKRIEARSGGKLTFRIASLLPDAAAARRPRPDPRALGGEARRDAPPLLPAHARRPPRSCARNARSGASSSRSSAASRGIERA
jgi:hypothetical protein